MIQLEQVTKLYGSVIGINEITMSLDSGTYGLLGPNGSGKTTLIKLILGQLRPTLGTVRLFGEDPWAKDLLLRNVGLCPASEVYYPKVTAFQWVRHLVQLHGFGSREATTLATAALQQVQMEYAMHRPMRDYSLGMRQRAKLAQAIAHKPELLILDEPFNGLDPVGRKEMTDFLRDWGKQGRSLILASHILHEVEAVNPSFMLISGGRLLASGSPEQVRALLDDTPNTVRICCSDARKLASLLICMSSVDEVSVHPAERNERGDSVQISTLSAGKLFSDLPKLVADHEIKIYEMKSSDESLGNLFAILMKIHRGESHGGQLV